MYRAIGAQKFATFFALAAGGLFAILWLVQNPNDLSSLWRLISLSVTVIGLAALIFGQTGLFPWFCRITILGRLFPYIDGEWHAELRSNWPEIAQRAGLASNADVVTGRVMIVARLFTIKLRYTSVSPSPEYLTSKTRSVQVERDAEDGGIRLFYIYESEVRAPEATDSSHHYGAAYLDLLDARSKKARLQGVYWTNRNWMQGLNTAGVIELQRAG